jgi:phage shock protein A
MTDTEQKARRGASSASTSGFAGAARTAASVSAASAASKAPSTVRAPPSISSIGSADAGSFSAPSGGPSSQVAESSLVVQLQQATQQSFDDFRRALTEPLNSMVERTNQIARELLESEARLTKLAARQQALEKEIRAQVAELQVVARKTQAEITALTTVGRAQLTKESSENNRLRRESEALADKRLTEIRQLGTETKRLESVQQISQDVARDTASLWVLQDEIADTESDIAAARLDLEHEQSRGYDLATRLDNLRA